MTLQPSENDLASEAAQQVVSPQFSAEWTRLDRTLHWLFLLFCVGILFMSLVMSSDNDFVYLPFSNKPLPESCTAKRFLGLSCPGCGLTRSFIAITHGRFSDAWALNQSSFFVYAFVFFQVPWHGMQLVRIHQKKQPWKPAWVYYLPIALAIVVFVTWLARAVQVFY